MKDWFYEFLFVLASSPRTVWAIMLGPVFCAATLILGKYMASNIELVGNYNILEGVVSEIIIKRYDKVALGVLLSFWVLAFKFYKKDKKRFDKYF